MFNNISEQAIWSSTKLIQRARLPSPTMSLKREMMPTRSQMRRLRERSLTRSQRRRKSKKKNLRRRKRRKKKNQSSKRRESQKSTKSMFQEKRMEKRRAPTTLSLMIQMMLWRSKSK